MAMGAMNNFVVDPDKPMPTDTHLTRRYLLKASAPTVGVAVAAPALSAARPANRIVSVADFGAKGDGIADDSAAFRAALATGQVVDVPPGTFRIEVPLVLSDGQVLRGSGRSGWEPYTGKGPPRSATRTEIIINGRLAIDARNSNNVAIVGIAIRAKEARQSDWGAEPGFQPGAIGIDIAGSQQFEARDVSFHGLEIGVESVSDGGRSAQMPHIGEWLAHDCGTVFRFISNDRDFYAVRDARIDGCIAALHCGRIAEIRKCDGLRIENVRFFQCKYNSLLIERTPFVAITGATLFETGAEAIVLRECQYVTMAGVQVARTGFYRAGKLIQQAALLIENCDDLAFDGLVEQPVGRAFTIRDSVNLSINAAIGTPFWSTGSLGSREGAIHIERSRAILINASFGGIFYWVAVWADAASASSINGRITTEGPAGVVRCVQLQAAPLGHVARTATATSVAPGKSVKLDELRVLVPPGKALVSCSIELTTPGIAFFAGQQRWNVERVAEPGGGSLSLERNLLHRNDTTLPRYAAVPIEVYNSTDHPITIPAGHETRLSLAIE